MTPSTTASPVSRVFVIWAASWATLLGLVFVATTSLTLGLWLTDASYRDTTPVTDLGFLALGAIIVVGFASQVLSVTRHPVGALQAMVGSAALALAGLLGNRIEPAVGGAILIAAATPLFVFHPERRLVAARISAPLTILALVAAVPATWYTAELIGAARSAGPSCFLGQCVVGDRYAELAALAVAIPLVTALASLQVAGWRLPAWSAAGAAMVLAGSSLLLPEATGSVNVAGAIAAAGWAAVVGAASWQAGASAARRQKGAVLP